ncbi:MAG: tyrosine--tRNA ligase, partial [Candidatus Diapherotrites archaeon]|nr:tyrosine--tRNA ligase [Candidatus Diapherotrites archaeon]
MDLEERIKLITGIGEETVTESDLRQLLETKSKPIAYDGFEPSGIAHLPVGLYRPLLIKDLLKAKVHFKLLVADSFGWINNKLGGDLEKIRKVGNYFIEVWKAAGVDVDKVDVVWHKDHFDDPEYWKKVIQVAKAHTEARTKRTLDIAGRTETDKLDAAQLFYPSMQCADIFQLKADICQLGMD